jgi:hypothetical protein
VRWENSAAHLEVRSVAQMGTAVTQIRKERGLPLRNPDKIPTCPHVDGVAGGFLFDGQSLLEIIIYLALD